MRGLLVLGAIACNVPHSPHVDSSPPSLRTLVAVHRLDAHDAAARRNEQSRHLCEVAREWKRAAFARIYGPLLAAREPATPGPLVLARGHAVTDTRRSDSNSESVELDVEVADGRLDTCGDRDDPEVHCPFECTDDAQALCWKLAAWLDETWGPSNDRVWFDRAHRWRASLSAGDECRVRFSLYVAPRAWIADNRTAEIPLAVLGKPAGRLPAVAERSWSYDPDAEHYRWNLAATGEHILRASIDALVKGGRIVRFEVAGELDEDGGADELHALVRPFFGRLPIEVHTRGTRFELAIGE